MDGEDRVVAVGAGPAGLSVALALKDLGCQPMVLDRTAEVGVSWRGRYDRLRLNTCRPLSHLPDRRFPKGTPMFPTRDQLIGHLERHAHEEGIDLRLGVPVDRIERATSGWGVHSSDGEIRVPQVVVATGYENVPLMPGWPGATASRASSCTRRSTRIRRRSRA